MEEVKVKIGIDDAGFANGLKRDIGQMEQLSATAKKSGMSIDDMGRHVKQLGHDIDEAADKGVAGFGRLEKAAIAFFSIQKAKEFVGKVYEVRSEIEKLETSFRVLVGNKAQADALFASIRKFAVETPMQLKDLAGAAQTMMGFGIATEDVMENLKALGNVAMGDSQKFQSLALAFSQMSATGKLMGQDFLQMVNAGFNPLDQMAKTTGKSVAVLKKEMSEGAISADMVRQAFIDATSEGGKFNGMLEAQSKTMAGAYSNLQGAIDDMLNEIGQKSEGIMSGAIEVATTLAQNYETVGKVLLGLIGTYGTYKVAVMTVTAVQSLQAASTQALTIKTAAYHGWLVLTQKAQALLNATMLTNPYVLAATAIAGVATALWAMHDSTTAEEAAAKTLADRTEELRKRQEELNEKTEEAIRNATDNADATGKQEEAMQYLINKYPELIKQYIDEKGHLKDIIELKERIAELNGENQRREAMQDSYNAFEDARQIYNDWISIRKRFRENHGAWSEADRKRYNQIMELYRQQSGSRNNSGDAIEKYYHDLAMKAKAQYESQSSSNFIANFTKAGGPLEQYTDAQLKALQQTLKSMKGQETAFVKELQSTLTGEDREGLLTRVTAMMEARSAPKSTPAAHLQALKQTLDDAQKALEDFEKSNTEYTAEAAKTERERLQKAVDDAEKAYKAFGGKIDNGGGNGVTYAKENAARRQKIFEQDLSERQRQAQQLEAMKDAQANAAIANEQSRAKRELMQLEKDHRDRLDAIDRQSEAMKKANYEAQKKAWEAANTDKTKSWSDTDTAKDVAANGFANIKLTEEQLSTLKALREKENAEYARSVKERLDAERQSMLDYLQEYGTYQQQRLAIAEEYSKRIAEAEAAGNKWEAKRLAAERDSRTAQANAQSLAMNIDWNQTFQGIGNVLKDIAKETLGKVNEYMGTAEFKGLDAAAKQAYMDLQKQLVEAGGQEASNPFSSKTWDEIARLTDEYKFHVKALADASERHTQAVSDYQDAVEREKKARAELETAIKNQAQHLGKSDQGEYDNAVNEARENLANATQGVADTFRQMQETGEQVQQQQANVNNTQQSIHQKTEAAAQGLNNFNTVLGQLTNGSLTGFVNGISNVIAALTKNTEDDMQGLIGVIGKKAGGIIGAILSIIDMLGDKPVEFFDSLLNGIASVVEAVISHIPEIIASIIKGVGTIVGSIFSGIAGLFGVGAVDNSAYEDALDKWGGILDAWEDNVKYERELMEKAYGVKAIDYSRQALKALEDTQKAAAEIYKGWASSGAGWFSHSHGYEDDRDTKWEYLWQYDEALARQLGVTKTKSYLFNIDIIKGDVSRLFDLTWEQLEEIQNRAPQFWASLSDEAKDYLGQYIEAGKTAKETLDALNEQLTTTTSENVFDDFLNSLYDLADGSEDVMNNIAENWQKMVNRMVINNTIGADFQKEVDGWYQRLASVQERYANGEMGYETYKAELDSIYSDYTGIVAKAQSKMEEFAEHGIIKTIGEASYEAFNTMSDDFKSALMDMSDDADDFGKLLKKKLYEALLERFVFNTPITVTIEGEDKVFENLDAYLADWQERSKAIIDTKELTDANAISTAEYEAQRKSLEEQIRSLEKAKASINDSYDKQIQSYRISLGQLTSRWGYLLAGKGEANMTSEELGYYRIMLNLQESIKKAEADRAAAIGANDQKIAALLKQIEELEGNVALTDEERAQALADLNKELEEQLALQKQIAKTYADMAGWTMEQKIDASPLATIGDDLLSALQNTTTDVKEWRKQIVEAMTNDLIKEVVYNSDFKEKIRALQEQYVHLFDTDENGNRINSDEDIASEIQKIADAIAKLYSDAEVQVDGLRDIVPDIDTSPFDNLRETFLDTLTNMEDNADGFKKKLTQTMVKDLIEKQVLNVPITVNDKDFKDFQTYVEDWNTRYANAVKSGNQEAIDALIDELVRVREMTVEAAEELRERLKNVESDTTFSDMPDSFVSALMDMDTSAKDWAESIGKAMAQKIIEQMVVANSIQPLLDDLQKAFNTAMSAEGATYETVMNDEGIQSQLTKIKEEYPALQALVKGIMEALGVNTKETKEGFSDLRGAFVSALMDMEGDAESFGKSIGKTMAEQMLDAYIDKTYSEEIDRINEEWADALASGDPTKIEAIRQKVLDLYAAIGDDETVKSLTADVNKLEQELDSTFSDMTDSWVSSLIDMDSKAADFGREIGHTLVEKLVKELVVSKQLQSYLDNIQTAYNDAIGKEGATIESVLAAVVPLIDAAVAETEKWKPVIEEVAKRFQELDKSTPLDNIRSSFLSQLMDMKSDTKDFARSINEILTEAFIDKFVLGEEFDKRLEEWQQQYASIMGGNYSEEERAKLLKQLRQAIVTAKEGYAAEAQAIHDLMGTANYADQTATMNMSDKATYEQMDQYLGVQMGIYMVTEQILTTLRGGTTIDIPAVTLSSFSMATETTAKQILSAIQTMKAATNPDSSTIQEMRNMMATGNEYLLDIKRSNREILTQFGAKLDSINGKLAKL